MTRLLAALGAVALAAMVTGCSDRATGTTARPGPPPVPVTAADVVERPVPIQVTAVGNVQAYTTVMIKSQISGQIDRIGFTEGRDVKRGDLLVSIDPRPFEAAVRQAEANVTRDRAQLRQAEAAFLQRQSDVKQAEANLARDQAQLENAQVQERRYRELVAKELVAKEQYDQFRTNVSTLEATVRADRAAVDNAGASAHAAQAAVDNAQAVIKADEAMVDNAKLQLAYTTIRAPMDGRTGNLLAQQGNIVKANDDGPLVVIAQIRPIYVSFSVAEQHLAAIKQYRDAKVLKVQARVPGQEPAAGELTFINNTVDATTGTIQLKATFPNSDGVLWPGQFVEVTLTLTTQPAIVVPSQAIQAGQQGAFVFVVKPDLTVEARPVSVGRRLEKDTVIERGVKPGERVVTDGQLRLVPGAKVDIKPGKPA
jgi:membrane fusion protein, multidrug efflux system